MKRLAFSLVLLSLFTTLSLAVTGDTTRVPVMDKYLWTWNGYQDRKVQCPDGSKTYEKILLRYTLTCPAGGCGEWDYTTGVVLRQYTGIIDSVLRDVANFKVAGNITDSIWISLTPKYTTFYNSTTKVTDSASVSFALDWYENPESPFTVTRTESVWPGNYWNYYYDASGNKIDSLFIAGDSLLIAQKSTAYFKYERIIPYELTRYITPYGKGFPKDWTRTWTMDITEFSSLLRDSVELRSFYDGWSQGSLYTLELLFIEGTPPRTTHKVEQIYNGYYTYGNPDDPIDDHVTEKKIFRDPTTEFITLRLTVTGHGSDPNGACEFIDKTHSIWVNGDERYEQHLWRDDCGINPTYPQTGTYWFPRAGWCPGDLVFPFDYDLTPFTQKNDSVSVDYNMAEYTSASPSGGYNIHGLLFYSSGPNFTTDVAAVDIKRPTSDYRYARTNPICSDMSPIIVIQNTGSEPLTSCKIGYYIDDQPQNEFLWTGNLAFLEKTEVTLPKIDLGSGAHTFHAVVFNPNGTNDQYSNNDRISSAYTSPKSYSNKIALMLRTDKSPEYNAIRWELVDPGSGTVIREGSGYDDGELVRDTFLLAEGCYRFTIYDEGLGEGLRPWVYQPNFTSGSYSLKDDKNVSLINVTANSNAAVFGNMQSTTFNVGEPSQVEIEKQTATFSAYPNPANESVSFDLESFGNEAITLTIYDVLGKPVMIKEVRSTTEAVDIRDLIEGSYIVRAESATMKASQRIVIER